MYAYSSLASTSDFLLEIVGVPRALDQNLFSKVLKTTKCKEDICLVMSIIFIIFYLLLFMLLL